ncbi:unnamed protein product [Paramecium octaurelia]|uniref:Uncharacterized protein n=1 Tax=Paramecium octaurelia TaxID=43137 RepID=A0A8S1UGB0_PAROT|nr:unnamed protein product [Paramecium octaurelia]
MQALQQKFEIVLLLPFYLTNVKLDDQSQIINLILLLESQFEGVCTFVQSRVGYESE